MTHADDTFERAVHVWLHADAEHRVPDHLDAVLRRTSEQRQRPAWSSPERWLPVDTTFRPRFFHVPQAGRLVLVAALIIALVALLVFAVGSHQQRLPPPFGPARNGIVLSSGDGDIVQVEPATLARHTIIGGPTFDFGPMFSHDGTQFLFVRGAPSDCGKPDCGLYLMVADANGSDVRQLTPGMPALDWADWSPDGSRIAILTASASGPGHDLVIVNTDGSGMRPLHLGRSVYGVGWRPPGGDEIVFRGDQLNSGDPPVGIFAVHPDGTGLRPLTTRPAHSDNDYQTVSISQDGNLIAYRDDGDPRGFQQHILDLRTGEDRILPGPRTQLGGGFSPDGTKIVYLRGVSGDRIRLVVAQVDGSSIGMLLGPAAPWGPDGPAINNYGWNADGTAILANYDDAKVARLLPIDGSTPIDLDHGDLALPAIQRLAP